MTVPPARRNRWTPGPYLLAGESFSRLTSLEDAAKGSDKILWRCTCGTEKRIRAGTIRTGKQHSCGCLQREASSAVMRRYHAQQPPRMTPEEERARSKDWNATYRERHREEIRKRHREWAQRNREQDPEAARQRVRSYRQVHGLKLEALRRAQRAARGREAENESARRIYAANPEKYRAKASRRRLRRRVDMDATDRLLSELYRKAIRNDPCYYCGTTEGVFHDDHYAPVVLGGTDHWFNLVRACASCNHRKSVTHGDDFIARLKRKAEDTATAA